MDVLRRHVKGRQGETVNDRSVCSMYISVARWVYFVMIRGFVLSFHDQFIPSREPKFTSQTRIAMMDSSMSGYIDIPCYVQGG